MKKATLFLFLCLLMTTQGVYAQQCARLDSLRRIIRLSKDIKVHIDALNMLSAEYAKESPDGAALVFARKALNLAKKYKHEKGRADALVNIGLIDYKELTEYKKAIKHFKEALAIYTKLGDKSKVAETQEVIGKFYFDLFYLRSDQGNYRNALEYYQKALALRKELGHKKQMAKIYEVISELYGHLNESQKAIDALIEAEKLLEDLGESKTNSTRLISKYKAKYEQIQALEKRNQYYLMGGIALLAVLALVLLFTAMRRKKVAQQMKQQKDTVVQQKKELEEQASTIAKQKSIVENAKEEIESFSLVPSYVFDEIREQGYYEPRQYDKVSVLFADLEDFTNVSQGMGSDKLVEELNVTFNKFDEISEKYNLIKIKTIGDSYMAAGGIPEKNHRNPVDAILAALEMTRFIDAKRTEKDAKGEPYWKVRIGINTGYVTAGVVGQKRFAYDVWGETVNTAKLIEIKSESGQVAVSRNTYDLIKDLFDVRGGGEVEMKHKEAVERYVITGIKAELSENNEGIVPNEVFKGKVGDMDLG
ncbi:adenylate/guanylate cyclase domain-containing protein [uncultured Microscilla sp.]|uniref:adenylate/guanylate cyclase domain-containing protein n=1 Tax=uncultured Microscilla sp. TaxID=432653 RepID=UPI0026091DBD|nr:adenylate/guanylate cyclase domain-containing protein [uncultured Microscilla sp.]